MTLVQEELGGEAGHAPAVPVRGRRGGDGRFAALRSLLSSPSGVASVTLIVAILLVAVLAPMLMGDAATKTDFGGELLSGSSAEHLLGTDGAGRDILARTLVGTRLSLVLALGATAVAAAIGLVLGSLLVTVGGRVQRAGMTVIDTWLGFPAILLAILVIAVLEPGGGAAAIAVGLSLAPFFARVTVTRTAGVAGLDYVLAARLLGLSRRRIAFRYVLASVADSLVVAVFSMLSECLIAVSALSFLGLGVQPQVGSQEVASIDWGRILNDSIADFRQRPEGTLGPALAIALCGLAFAWFGDSLGRALNPQVRPVGLRWRRRRVTSAAAMEEGA